jgi:hypothetical protein
MPMQRQRRKLPMLALSAMSNAMAAMATGYAASPFAPSARHILLVLEATP